MPDSFVKHSVSTDLAHRLIALAERAATKAEVPSVIAIVDEAGVLKALSRMDGALHASVEVAIDKAYSAAVTGLATDQWYGIAQADPAFGFGVTSIRRLCPIGGGVPVVVEGELVGGLGVSGGTVADDIGAASAALTGSTG